MAIPSSLHQHNTVRVEIRRTLDGSDTLFVPDLNEHYHSTFGAIQESRHVFIENGLMALEVSDNPISVFEVGFGTGLNALLTDLTSKARRRKVVYTAIDLFPLDPEFTTVLNYPACLGEAGAPEEYRRIHEAPWELPVEVNPFFQLTKIKADLRLFDLQTLRYDVIFFDAFAPEVQPGLWTTPIFEKMHGILNPNGILITYSCKGVVKRSLLEAGFSIEKLPGPPGKREILRARRK